MRITGEVHRCRRSHTFTISSTSTSVKPTSIRCGGKIGRSARGRRKKREPGRGHYEKPASHHRLGQSQGAVVIQATRDFTVKTVQKAAEIAVRTGSRLYTDSASSYRAVKGYVHEFVNHTQLIRTHKVVREKVEQKKEQVF